MPGFDVEMASELWRLGVALAIGLVVGGEREQRKGAGPGRAAAGIRTFALAGLLGGVGGMLGPWPLTASALFVGAAALVSYALGDRSDPGLTTEVALVVTFALGALAVPRPAVAFSAGVGAAMVLAARTGMHAFLRETLSERELRDALVLGVSALVVLPLLPNRYLGPLDAVNPQLLWKLAVVLMAVTALGHVAQRALGPALGLAVAGRAGGFASSAATISGMAARAREDASVHAATVAGAVASTVATFVQLAIVVRLASPRLLSRLALPLTAGGALALLYAAAWTWRATRSRATLPSRGRAFSVPSALLFAAFVGVIGVVSALAAARFGPRAVPVAAALAGFADAHASAASAASLQAAGVVSEQVALVSVMAAFSTNALTKGALAF
jgi:uncharacterized membrane protein (DUF4010 family)